MAPPAPASYDETRPIRVGFVLHAMQVAGAEVLVKETIRRLGPAIVPTIFCLDRVGKLGEDHVREGGDLVCFDRRPGRDFGVSRRLASEIRRRNIAVVHAHQYTPFFYSALAKPFTGGAKLILTEHGRHFPDVVSSVRRAVNRLVLDKFADAVNACCEFSGQALYEKDGFAGGRIRVIENGIDESRYGPAPDHAAAKVAVGLPPGRRYLMTVARHHPVKDQAMLVSGFAAAAAEFPDVDLVLVGDGPLRPDLERLAVELGVGPRVRFAGVQSNVPDWLRAADVFALTSVSEAASLTLLEAMATGLPVIVTAVGGNPEIVRDGIDGILVPRGDAAACGAAIRTLFQDPAFGRRFGGAGRRRVQDRYTLAATVSNYYRLYQSMSRGSYRRPV